MSKRFITCFDFFFSRSVHNSHKFLLIAQREDGILAQVLRNAASCNIEKKRTSPHSMKLKKIDRTLAEIELLHDECWKFIKYFMNIIFDCEYCCDNNFNFLVFKKDFCATVELRFRISSFLRSSLRCDLGNNRNDIIWKKFSSLKKRFQDLFASQSGIYMPRKNVHTKKCVCRHMLLKQCWHWICLIITSIYQ